MPSRSNPNTLTTQKRKTFRSLQRKRTKTQNLLHQKKIFKPVPRTSQAMRRAASPSQKKLRKLERKMGYLRRRREEEKEGGEVEMRDVSGDGEVGEMMEIDEVRGGGGGGEEKAK